MRAGSGAEVSVTGYWVEAAYDRRRNQCVAIELSSFRLTFL